MRRIIFAILLSVVASTLVCGQNIERHRHHDRRHVCVDPIATQKQIEDIVDYISKRNFDDDKMGIAKLCVTLVPIPTDGLFKIAKLFSFDEKRKEFLYFAYEYCPDKENYVKLRKTFIFSSNAEEFCNKFGF